MERQIWTLMDFHVEGPEEQGSQVDCTEAPRKILLRRCRKFCLGNELGKGSKGNQSRGSESLLDSSLIQALDKYSKPTFFFSLFILAVILKPT